MSMPRWFERPGTRQSGSEPPTQTLSYGLEGVYDAATARSLALSLSQSAVATTQGILYRQDLQVKEVGTGLYYIEVPYGVAKRVVGSYRETFDTTGGTANIKVAFGGTTGYAATGTAPDDKGSINVQEDNTVEGCDIVIPAFKLTTHFKHPMGIVTRSYQKQLARNTGKINSDPFLECAPGEVLFLGATGSGGTDAETELQYHFALSENISDLIINGITVAEKRGWDVLWYRFENNVDSAADNRFVKQPKFIYVSKVYREFNMSAFFGF